MANMTVDELDRLKREYVIYLALQLETAHSFNSWYQQTYGEPPTEELIKSATKDLHEDLMDYLVDEDFFEVLGKR